MIPVIDLGGIPLYGPVKNFFFSVLEMSTSGQKALLHNKPFKKGQDRMRLGDFLNSRKAFQQAYLAYEVIVRANICAQFFFAAFDARLPLV